MDFDNAFAVPRLEIAPDVAAANGWELWLPPHAWLATGLTVFMIFWFFAVGASIGSFVNVIVYRWPRRRALTYPPSSCPVCGHRIRTRHNVPVLGWLMLGGRCYDCKVKIPATYPRVELVFGLIAAGLAAWEGAAGFPMLRSVESMLYDIPPAVSTASPGGMTIVRRTIAPPPTGLLERFVQQIGGSGAWLGYVAAGVHFLVVATLAARALTGSHRGWADLRLVLPAAGLVVGLAAIEPRLIPWPAGPIAWPTPGTEAVLSSLAGGLTGLVFSVIACGGDATVWSRRMPGAVLVGLAAGWLGAIVIVGVGTVLLLFHRVVGRLRPARTPDISVRPTPPDATTVDDDESDEANGAGESDRADEAHPSGEGDMASDSAAAAFPLAEGQAAVSVPSSDNADEAVAVPADGTDSPVARDAAVDTPQASVEPVRTEASRDPSAPPPQQTLPDDPERAFDGALACGLILAIAAWPFGSATLAEVAGQSTLLIWTTAGLITWLAARWTVRLKSFAAI